MRVVFLICRGELPRRLLQEVEDMTQYRYVLETGHPQLDRRLHRLMDAAGDFIDACAKGQGRALPQQELDTLQRYAKKYFEEEELLQKRERYPGYQEHKQQHDAFLKHLNKLDFQLRSEGVSPDLCAELRESLWGRLAEHIQQSDRPFVDYLRTQQTPMGQAVVIANLLPSQSM